MPRGRSRRRAPLPSVLLTAVLALGVSPALSGCVEQPIGRSAASTDPTAHCRKQFEDLGARIKERGNQTDPSDLAPRWSSVIGTVAYYAHGATADDCRAALPRVQESIERIRAFSDRLRTYDLAHRLGSLAPAALDFLTAATGSPSPGPSATSSGQPSGDQPSGQASTHRKRAKRHRPTAKRVRRALTTLQRQIPVAVADMQDGWDEANSIDLGDASARRRARHDLAFLAGDSAAYQACLHALGVLRRAAAAVD